jgi:hypothetical protein
MTRVTINNLTPYAQTISDPRGGFSVQVPAGDEKSFTVDEGRLNAMAGALNALANKEFDGLPAFEITVEEK